jgi:lipopolysaccharide export system protein LptA
MFPDRRFILLACALMLALAPAARALKSDADKPVEISADRLDHTGSGKDNTATSVYTGHVVITQGSIRITADKATLHLENGKLVKAFLVGSPATFRQKRADGEPIRGHADTIHYDTQAHAVVLIDDAKVHQGDELVTAKYIRYDYQRQSVVAHRAKRKKHGRVHIVIPPAESGH